MVAAHHTLPQAVAKAVLVVKGQGGGGGCACCQRAVPLALVFMYHCNVHLLEVGVVCWCAYVRSMCV